jgi:hypothetical protein
MWLRVVALAASCADGKSMGTEQPRRYVAPIALVCSMAFAGCGAGDAPNAAAVNHAQQAASSSPTPVSWHQISGEGLARRLIVQPTGRDRSCVGYRPEVVETKDRVTITVIKDERGCSGDTATPFKSPPALPVALKAPVNGRTVVDGAAPAGT